MAMLLLVQLLTQGELERWIDNLNADTIAVRQEAEQRLLEAGEAARHSVERVAEGGGEQAFRARRVLRGLDFEAAIPPVARAQIPGLRAQLTHANPDIRRKALHFKKLAGVFDPTDDFMSSDSLQGLFHAFLTDPDPTLRVEAATAIECDPEGRAAVVALDFLRRYEHPDFDALRGEDYASREHVRKAAARVARTGMVSTADLAPLLQSPHGIIRAQALRALRQLKFRDVALLARALLKDPDDGVVLEALRYLADGAEAVDVADLLTLAEGRDWDDLLWELRRAFRRSGAREAAPALARIAMGKEHGRGAPLFYAAAELDPSSVRTEALQILTAAAAGQRSAFTPYAIEALGLGGDTSHLDLVLAALRNPLEVDQGHYGYSQLARAAARCVPRGRMGDLLDICLPSIHDEPLMREHDDFFIQMLWYVAKNLDPASCRDLLLRRAHDPQLEVEKRRTAAQMLNVGDGDPERLGPLLADRVVPLELRRSLLRILPRNKALADLAEKILLHPDDPLRPDVVRLLFMPYQADLRATLVRMLDADETLAIPVVAYGGPPPGSEAFGRILARRLQSDNPVVFGDAVTALSSNGACGLEDRLAEYLLSERRELRWAAASVIRKAPDERYRAALRVAAGRETCQEVLAGCLEAIRKLGDREGLAAARGREIPKDSPAYGERLKAVAVLGTREELLALAECLDGPPYRFPSEAIPALLKTDTEAGRRLVGRALAHPWAPHREAAAKAIGEARLSEFLPSLRSMVVTETAEVRKAAIQAVGAFDRPEWLSAYRAALRTLTYSVVPALSRAIVEKGDVALAMDLLPLLDDVGQYGAYQSALWSHTLDALVNRKAYRTWAEIELRGKPETLGEVQSLLHEKGVAVSFSAEAAALAVLPAIGGSADRGTIGDWLAYARPIWIDGRPDKEVYFAHISGPDGLRIVTLDEALTHWRKPR